MSQFVETPTKTFKAGGAIGEFILVKLSSGVLAVAGLAEEPIGVIEQEAFVLNDVRAVRLLSAQGTIKCVAANAIDEAAIVYGRAAGKVDDVATSSAIRIGIALEAATATNDIIEVLPC